MSAASRAVLLAFLLLAFGLLFRELVTLIVAALITVLVAIPLAAAADRLAPYRIPRAVSVLGALLLGLGLLGGVLALIIPPFGDQIERFADELPAIADTLEQKLGDVLAISPAQIGDSAQNFLQRFLDDPGALLGPLTSIGIGVAGVVGGLLVILITAVYIAIDPRPLVDGGLALFPPERRDWAEGVAVRLRAAWIGWMQGVLVDMVITGVLLYVGLTLIDLDFAVVFAVFSAILVLIPYFGAIAAGIPPVVFALTDSPEKALLTLVIYLGVQQVESNVTVPLVMANRVKLHPAIVAIGVVIVGQLFGIIGLFVAVPILSLIVILVQELWIKPTEAERDLEPADRHGLTEEELAAEERAREELSEDERARRKLAGG